MRPEGDEDAGSGDTLVPASLLKQVCRLQVALRLGSNAPADSLQSNNKYTVYHLVWCPTGFDPSNASDLVCDRFVTDLIHFGEVGPQQGLALPSRIRRPLLHEPLQLQRQRPLPPTPTSAAGGHLPVNYASFAKLVID